MASSSLKHFKVFQKIIAIFLSTIVWMSVSFPFKFRCWNFNSEVRLEPKSKSTLDTESAHSGPWELRQRPALWERVVHEMPSPWCSVSAAEQTEALFLFSSAPCLCSAFRDGWPTYRGPLEFVSIHSIPFHSPQASFTLKPPIIISKQVFLWFLVFTSLLFSSSSHNLLVLWMFLSRFFLKWVLKLDSPLTQPSFQTAFYYNYLIGHCLSVPPSHLWYFTL